MAHKSSLSELSKEEWQDFESLLKTMEKATKDAFGATHFNWSCLMNEARRSADSLPHVHWHMFPRYSKAVKFKGTIFKDTEFGQHYANRQFKVSQSVLSTIGLRLTEKLQKRAHLL